MFLIAGLGNPGKKYENTRHNLGFITVDRLAEKLGISIKKSKFKSLIGEGIYNGEKVILIKPQTYMNNSGEAIREAANYYDIDHEKFLVIYDDLDIPRGNVRIRSAGSSGTHNGMRSVIYQLGWDDFPRIRIGIGIDKTDELDSAGSERDLVDYVIGGFTKEEVKPLEDACDTAVSAILCYMDQGIDIAMNRFNSHRKKSNKKGEAGDEVPDEE